MLNEVLSGSSAAVISGLVGFFISKKITSANFDIYVEKAKAQAGAIENEAQLLLYKANIKSQEIELEATKLYESAKEKAKMDLLQREDDILRKEQSFKRYKQNEERKLQDEVATLKARQVDLKRNEKSLSSLKKRYEEKIDEALNAWSFVPA
jgi:ribonuclease Y